MADWNLRSGVKFCLVPFSARWLAAAPLGAPPLTDTIGQKVSGGAAANQRAEVKNIAQQEISKYRQELLKICHVEKESSTLRD